MFHSEKGPGYRIWHIVPDLLVTWESYDLWQQNVRDHGFEPNWYWGGGVYDESLYVRVCGVEVTWIR